jgi:hypothetical protein
VAVKKGKGKALLKSSAQGGKAWRDAIRLELARGDGPNGTTLERIARIVVNNALNGDFEAIQEIANRIDGKVAVQDHHEAGEPINRLVVTWEQPRERIEAPFHDMKTIEHGALAPGGSRASLKADKDD